MKSVTARARILYAALALRSFTAKDIAEYSGIDISTVRTQLIRDRSLFASGEREISGRRGGSFKRYQLLPEARQKLLEASAEARSYLAAREAETGDTDVDNRQRFDVALKAAHAAVRQARAAHEPTLRARQKKRAEALIAAVESVAEFVPSDAETAERIAELKRDLQSISIDVPRAPVRAAPVERKVSASLSDTDLHRVEAWFEEWAPGFAGRVASPAVTMSESALDEEIDASLTVVRNSPEPVAIFAPAAVLFKQMGAATVSARRYLGGRLAERLSSTEIAHDRRAFSALAVMAAVFDCETALDSLLVATLHSHVGADGDASERGVILRALARFARPRGVSVWRSAASYAQALLGKSDRHPADFSDLVAAALRAKMVDPRVLLHRYSERTYGHPHSSLDLNASREATVMRNITIALHEVGFTPLVDELPTLLTHDYGRAFFKALSNPTYGALDLLDRDGHDYVVRLGPLIAQRLAIKRPPDVPIPIDSQSAEGEVLYRLMEERSVAYRSAQDETLAATLWSTRTQELNDSALVEEGGVLAEEDAAADPVEPYGRITQRLAGSHAHKHYGALAH